MSKCPPPPHDRIHIMPTPPRQQNIQRTLTAHRPQGRWIAEGHPSDGWTLPTMMLLTVLTVPTGAEFHVIPCSGGSTPSSHEKIPCSVPNRKRYATRSTRYGNRRRTPPKRAEIGKIPCCFPCSQGIPRAACSSGQGRSQSWRSAGAGVWPAVPPCIALIAPQQIFRD